MVCSFCKNTVKFRDFYTCKELEKDVAELINLIRNSQSQLESGSLNDGNDDDDGDRPGRKSIPDDNLPDEDSMNNRQNEGEEEDEEDSEARTS